MDFKISKHTLAFSLFFLLFSLGGFAQKLTSVRGKIIDKATKEPMPFVTVGFKGTTVGATTDLDGVYELDAKIASSQIEVSSLGYTVQLIPVVMGEKQVGVNQNVDVMRFSGVINPATIQPGNLVSSTLVADARLEYRGRGDIDRAQTTGWLARFFP